MKWREVFYPDNIGTDEDNSNLFVKCSDCEFETFLIISNYLCVTVYVL